MTTKLLSEIERLNKEGFTDTQISKKLEIGSPKYVFVWRKRLGLPRVPKANKYTVYDKNGQYIIEGTAKQCAARLGIREDSFYFNVGLSRRGALKKYEIYEVKE